MRVGRSKMGTKLYSMWMNKSKSEKRKIIESMKKDFRYKLTEEEIEEIVIRMR